MEIQLQQAIDDVDFWILELIVLFVNYFELVQLASNWSSKMQELASRIISTLEFLG